MTTDNGRFTVGRAMAPAMITTPGHGASRRRQRKALPAWCYLGAASSGAVKSAHNRPRFGAMSRRAKAVAPGATSALPAKDEIRGRPIVGAPSSREASKATAAVAGRTGAVSSSTNSPRRRSVGLENAQATPHFSGATSCSNSPTFPAADPLTLFGPQTLDRSRGFYYHAVFYRNSMA